MVTRRTKFNLCPLQTACTIVMNGESEKAREADWSAKRQMTCQTTSVVKRSAECEGVVVSRGKRGRAMRSYSARAGFCKRYAGRIGIGVSDW